MRKEEGVWEKGWMWTEMENRTHSTKPLLVLEADSAGWLPENQPGGRLKL